MAPHTTIHNKLKVHLKTSITRLRIHQSRDEALAKQGRRQLATLLEAGKYESARIRVENIIRSDLTTELYEILELYCELLLARSALLEGPTLDAGLEEAVRSILFAAPRTEVKELQQARILLVEKYGKELMKEVSEGTGVADRVRRKLRVEPPSQELVESYLKAIANAYDVAYGSDGEAEQEGRTQDIKEDKDDDTDDDTSGGGLKETPLTTAELSTMTPPKSLGTKSPVSIAPPSPSTERPNPHIKGTPDLKPSAKMKAAAEAKQTSGAKKPEGQVPDVDDLAQRFKLLKR